MTTDEQKAVEALSQGLPPRRGTRRPRPSGMAFALPSWMQDPDPARHRQRTPEEQAARHEADTLGMIQAGRVPAEVAEEEAVSYNPLTQAAAAYQREQAPPPLYMSNPGALGNPILPSGERTLIAAFSALLAGLFGVDVPATGDRESFYLAAIGPLTRAAVARAGGGEAGRPGNAMREARLPKLPLLLQAAKEEGPPETRRTTPEWQQTTAGAPRGLR